MSQLPLRARLTTMVTVVFGLALVALAMIGLNRMEAALRADVERNAEVLLANYFADLQQQGFGGDAGSPADTTRLIYLDASGKELPSQEFDRLVELEIVSFIREQNPFGFPGLAEELLGEATEDTGPSILFEATEMFSTEFELFGLDGPSRVIERDPDVIAVGAPIILGESEITVAVSSPLQPVRDSIDRLREGLLLAVPLLVLAIAFATWLIVGRALRPVEAMTARVDRITAESLEQRVPQPVGRDELSHLASTMNKMLARLQTSRDAQRQFISDASHELRSPITAIGATLEVAQRDPDNVDWHKTSGVLFDENLRLAGLVDDLLLSASLDEAPLGTDLSEVDLDEVCISEAARPHPCEVHVRVESPARVRANLGHIRRAVRNLVDNAARHATTRVDVVVASIDGHGVIEIVDDGPGIAPESLNVIFERFTRLDESRHRASTSEARHGGAGLGLAITRQIAEAHGGSVTAENRPDDGGARLTLQLPIEVDSVRGSRGSS